MKIPKGGVAVFDSGIGGMTVFNACKKQLPNTLFYYYGDNRNAPYGNRSAKEIYRLTKKAFNKFKRLKVKAAVIACNTVTTICIDKLRKKYSFPIIGTEPAVLSAAKKGGRVFVLTTKATFESDRFQKLCAYAREQYPQAEVMPFYCSGLAGEIERCLPCLNYDFTKWLPRGKPTIVVLGCTHYIYIEEVIRQYYSCEVVHGNAGVVNRLLSILTLNEKAVFLKKDAGIRDRQPHLTTQNKKCKVLNKCSRNNALKTYENSETNNVVFLGKDGKNNEIRYKQLFLG